MLTIITHTIVLYMLLIMVIISSVVVAILAGYLCVYFFFHEIKHLILIICIIIIALVLSASMQLTINALVLRISPSFIAKWIITYFGDAFAVLTIIILLCLIEVVVMSIFYKILYV